MLTSKPNAFGCTGRIRMGSISEAEPIPTGSECREPPRSIGDRLRRQTATLPETNEEVTAHASLSRKSVLRVSSTRGVESIRHTVADDIGTVARAQQILNYIVLVGYRAR